MTNEDVKRETITLIKNVAIIDGIIFLLCSFCFFIGYMQIPLGFLLGSAISIFNYFLLYRATDLSNIYKIQGNVLRNYVTRLLIYAMGLAIALYLQVSGYNIFAWYTVFAGYLTIKIYIYLEGLIKKKKENKQ